jgi:SepF-like predicted cell division protein (DUF552 family)
MSRSDELENSYTEEELRQILKIHIYNGNVTIPDIDQFTDTSRSKRDVIQMLSAMIAVIEAFSVKEVCEETMKQYPSRKMIRIIKH